MHVLVSASAMNALCTEHTELTAVISMLLGTERTTEKSQSDKLTYLWMKKAKIEVHHRRQQRQKTVQWAETMPMGASGHQQMYTVLLI